MREALVPAAPFGPVGRSRSRAGARSTLLHHPGVRAVWGPARPDLQRGSQIEKGHAGTLVKTIATRQLGVRPRFRGVFDSRGADQIWYYRSVGYMPGLKILARADTDAVTAPTNVPAPHDRILELLEEGHEAELVGLTENEHLDFKAQYRLTDDRDKWGFAKDLAALVNSGAGRRYGIDSVVLWPRLFLLLSPEHARDVDDEVTQLDLSARLVTTWAAAALAVLCVLLSHPHSLPRHAGWLAVPVLLAVLARLAYRAAVESALAHASDLEVALDLYRTRVPDAMRLQRTRSLRADRAQFGAALSAVHHLRQ